MWIRALRSPARLTAIALVLACLAPLAGSAEDRPPIVISDPSAKQYRAAVQRFATATGSDPGIAEVLRGAIEEGLAFSGLFAALPEAAFLGPIVSPPLDAGRPPVCDNWRQIGTDALVQGQVAESADALVAEFQVLDVARGCRGQLRKRYRGQRTELGRMGRAIADDVVGAFTGARGVSDTEIAFVSNRTGAKEIWVMDADGGNLRAGTRNRSINTFPDWSPDGESIVYTSYRFRGRPHLFLLTRGSGSPGRILRNLDSSRPFYRGVFAPGGGRLALVSSVNGAAEIFGVGVDGSGLRRLTRDGALDLSPSWAPDGRRLTFVSDRSGTPQVYVMNADGSGTRRLTFEGSYNTAPAWSPDGRWIAYESRAGGTLDIWLIDPDGQVNVPLVVHPRADEKPSWSPDGRTIVFSSTRRGLADLYLVDVTGGTPRRLTQGKGDDTSPAWGPYRR